MSTRSRASQEDKVDLPDLVYPPSGASSFYPPDTPADTPTSRRSLNGLSSPSTPLATPALRDDQEVIFALPPVDTGYAWIYLTAAFFVELLAFGYTFSVGIFTQYWRTILFPGPEHALILTLAATVQSGLMYITAILITPSLTRYPEYRAHIQHIGCLISALGILLSGFVTQPWHLVVTSGVLYPVGGAAVYLPAATLLFEWFQTKRGLANGIMYSGAGLGGVVFPLIMQALLQRYSYKAALTSLAIGYAVLTNIAVYFVRPRVPVTRRGRGSTGSVEFRRTRIPLTFFKRSAFWAFGATIVLTSLASFLPSIYLPTYAVDIGLSENTGTLLLVAMNLASVFGTLVLGYLSDRWPLKLVVFLTCLGSSISAFLLFGFANNLAVLTLFAIMWGFFGLGFTSLWTRLITVIAKGDPISPPTIFGVLFMVRGVCNVLSGPISSLLLQGAALPDARFAYGVKDYGGLILFIGATNAIGSIAGIAYRD